MPAPDELKAENARLAARVADLEARLAAKPPIDRATLYRMVDHSPWGVMAVNQDRRLDYANPAMARWLAEPPPAAMGQTLEVLAPGLLALLGSPLERALAGDFQEVTGLVRDTSGEAREIRLTIAPRGGGEAPVNGAIVSLYDVTETQALDRSVRESEARLTHINTVTPNVNYIFDFERGAPIWAAGPTEAVYGYSIERLVGGDRELIRAMIHPEDQPKVALRLAELAAQPDGHVAEFELRVRRRDGRWRWILDRAVTFERDAEGRVVKTLSAAIDIDERKRAEERRIMLINELNHRVKNTLAAVQSIARQTLRPGRPLSQAVEMFNSRLVALSSAHDVLTRENWEGAGLREILVDALAPFRTQGEARFTLEGEDVRLSARAALALSMALHELATNAAKHGALSVEAGTIVVSWRTEATPEGGRLHLEWRESGGPPVVRPDATGFGARLLTQGLAADLDGAAELVFARDGVICRISAPLEAAPILQLA